MINITEFEENEKRKAELEGVTDPVQIATIKLRQEQEKLEGCEKERAAAYKSGDNAAISAAENRFNILTRSVQNLERELEDVRLSQQVQTERARKRWNRINHDYKEVK